MGLLVKLEPNKDRRDWTSTWFENCCSSCWNQSVFNLADAFVWKSWRLISYHAQLILFGIVKRKFVIRFKIKTHLDKIWRKNVIYPTRNCHWVSPRWQSIRCLKSRCRALSFLNSISLTCMACKDEFVIEAFFCFCLL